MFARPHIVLLVGLIGLGACTPTVAPDQVAVRFYPPAWKNPTLQQQDKATCTRAANNYVRIYVECMQRLGYRPEIIGEGGVPMSVSQLPQPPSAPSPQQHQPSIVARGTPRAIQSEESQKYSRLLDRLVAEDSRSWALNQYDQGSMRNAVVEKSSNGNSTLVKGYYTYNHGKPSWVEAKLSSGRLSCLHYWDTNDCRQLGQGLGTQLEAVAAAEERDKQLHPTRESPSESEKPSALECGVIYSNAPLLLGMAGC